MDRVLVAVDDSQEARDALKYALEQFPEATIYAAHVPEVQNISFDTSATASMTDEAEDRAEAILETAMTIAAEHDRTIEPELVFGHPAKAMVSYAEENDIDQIVVGSRGKDGVKRVLLGSIAETIMRRANCPVTVVR
ncbi:universal stress protein [Natronorubrum sp. JWXQ-INN-674]|uniref:Universal stress protein n=1 Tax=Natronorubrum halalkaliphilum TaxID=2691917 RepID=A0A6B0VTC9_9EURY|nr:universal stress protein [Natronorubrum halalkaliphilum]MXV64146.1 universal stress protein [Natronorubrum halalkaliphilum]